MTTGAKLIEHYTAEIGQDDGQPLIENLSTPETLLTRSELMAALGVSYITLYRLIKTGMPSYGRHRSARFKLSECLAWLATQKLGVTRGKKIQR